MTDRRYFLTRAADSDHERLYEHGIETFGPRQADLYYDGLMVRLDAIADSPLAWPAADHIRPGYRRSVYRTHSIYFRALAEGIEIVRILGHENPETSLPEA